MCNNRIIILFYTQFAKDHLEFAYPKEFYQCKHVWCFKLTQLNNFRIILKHINK